MIPELDINFQSKEIQENPYPLYEYLLSNYPIFKFPDKRVAVCSHEGATFILNHPHYFSVGSPALVSPDWQAHRRGMFILTQDNPEHERNKSIVKKAFVHRIIDQLEPFMRDRVSKLLRGAKGRPIEFFKEIGYPYATSVIGSLLGTLDTQDRHMERVYRWIELLERDTMERPSDEHIAAIEAAYAHLDEWYEQITSERRANPRDDIISALVHASVDGKPLNRDAIFGAIDLFLIAGFQSTAQFLACALIFLAKRTDIRKELVSNPTRIPSFIEEMLRFGGPAHSVLRFAKTDVEILGYTIPANTLISVFIAAANRDPRQFEAPNDFILNRPNIRRQIGFGGGLHTCIGAALARLEVKVALEVILSESEGFSCPEYKNIDWLHTPTTRGARSLPMTFL